MVALAALVGALAPASNSPVEAQTLPFPGCAVDALRPLRRGDVGDGVWCVEAALQAFGHLRHVDGNFDRDTRRAVRAFQRTQGLKATGTVTMATAVRLGVAQGRRLAGVQHVESRVIGTSAAGRPIVAHRLGTPGGVVVLVVGVIHGNEQAGLPVVQELRLTTAIPPGIDLWVIDTVNPDGQVRNIRTNGNGVDLNRNFAAGWQPIDCVEHADRCSGPFAASEPETQAVQAFITAIQPRVSVWYHGRDNAVDEGAMSVVAEPWRVSVYAERARMEMRPIECRPLGRCTGTATQFTHANVVGASAWVVELPYRSRFALRERARARHIDALFLAIGLLTPG